VSWGPPERRLRLAYLVNQYPWVSQAFIRREILAMERQGAEVLRIALRGWNYPVVDPEDCAEQARTRYVLRDGVLSLVGAVLRSAGRSPRRFLAAARLALRMSRESDRGIAFHLAYLAEACRVCAWTRAWGAQHVHAHFGTNSAEVAMLAHELGAPPFSMTVHGPDEFDRPRALGLSEKLKRAAFSVAISSFGRSQLYRWAHIHDWPKIHVVHCGLEEAFHDVPETPPTTRPRLVCVGRLSEQKGQALLIEAAALLAAGGTEFELVLAGDGDGRAQLEDLIKRRELGGRVRITGWITSAQVREELLAAKGLVSASFAEGLPVVIMEAMALRRPVVATRVAGVPELVRPGVDGWLVAPGCVQSLAAAMESLLTAPQEMLARMGGAARSRVLDRHSVDVQAGKLLGHVRDAVGKREYAA
jgi:glycosyltransferase involved in cell wall biosynthesis